VHHELHAAGLVEEALEDDRLLARHDPERREPGSEVVGNLARRRRRQTDIVHEPAAGLEGDRGVVRHQALRHLGAQARHGGG